MLPQPSKRFAVLLTERKKASKYSRDKYAYVRTVEEFCILQRHTGVKRNVREYDKEEVK